MKVEEDLEKEDLDGRRCKYLNDNGSISPIEESAEEDEVATNLEHDDECDIKLVSFILRTQCLDKPGREKQVPYDFTHMWSLMNKMN